MKSLWNSDENKKNWIPRKKTSFEIFLESIVSNGAQNWLSFDVGDSVKIKYDYVQKNQLPENAKIITYSWTRKNVSEILSYLIPITKNWVIISANEKYIKLFFEDMEIVLNQKLVKDKTNSTLFPKKDISLIIWWKFPWYVTPPLILREWVV